VLADSVELVPVPEESVGTTVALQEGEYLLLAPPPLGDGPSLLLFLQLAEGYQECELPNGWPEEGAPRALLLTDRVWAREELLNVLPPLSGEGEAPAERRGVTAVA
jgi:hypothetical protein